MVFFGWRAAIIALLAVFSCVLIERSLYYVTRTPALHGRSHAYLTGMLLAATLPPFVPWYVPVIGAAFAILLGKAIFGGLGHFLWQPALVGRLAVAALFTQPIAAEQFAFLGRGPADALSAVFSVQMNPPKWPLLSQDHILVGDLANCQPAQPRREWLDQPAPKGAAGALTAPPAATLDDLTIPEEPRFGAMARFEETRPPPASPAVLALPPINELLIGARPGGIGETSAIVIVIAGLYLVYRHYVRWHLPLAFVLAAAMVAALGPLHLLGPEGAVVGGWGPPGGWLSGQLPAPFFSAAAWSNWLGRWGSPPILREGLDVGFLYVCYRILSSELLLAAFFLATEMTSRPVTSGGQVLFGAGCGAIGMVLALYTRLTIPFYLAVLIMNTFTPAIDALWRPRVIGTGRRAARSRMNFPDALQ